jgi:hypothetical protein
LTECERMVWAAAFASAVKEKDPFGNPKIWNAVGAAYMAVRALQLVVEEMGDVWRKHPDTREVLDMLRAVAGQDN